MGAMPYSYYVNYQPDLQAALRALRDREFQAGRYNPAMPFVQSSDFFGADARAPGAQHASILDALLASDADGTRSILDLFSVEDTPGDNVAHRLSDEQLQQLLGTTRPTHEIIENCDDLFEPIERGQGVCIVVYKDDQPDEIFFAGYSFD